MPASQDRCHFVKYMQSFVTVFDVAPLLPPLKLGTHQSRSSHGAVEHGYSRPAVSVAASTPRRCARAITRPTTPTPLPCPSTGFTRHASSTPRSPTGVSSPSPRLHDALLPTRSTPSLRHLFCARPLLPHEPRTTSTWAPPGFSFVPRRRLGALTGCFLECLRRPPQFSPPPLAGRSRGLPFGLPRLSLFRSIAGSELSHSPPPSTLLYHEYTTA
jgi:hypothetical protein